MVRRDGDHQKHGFRAAPLPILKEPTASERIEAQQIQAQRTRNADALARARSAARLSRIR